MTTRRLATHVCRLCGWHGLLIPFDEKGRMPVELVAFGVVEYQQHVDWHVEDVCERVRESA